MRGLFCWAVASMALALLLPSAAVRGEPIPPGAGRFAFQPADGSPMDVWTYRPDGGGTDLPVLFVMHGTRRNADDYRDQWIEHAQRLGMLLVVPEFTKKAYPSGEGYQQLSVTDKSGELRPAEEWAPRRIEEVFDYVVRENRLETPSYYLYGHSAGGQFVHRMMLLVPDARVALALPANPGWYTLPRLETSYPEGLGGTPVTEGSLRHSLAGDVVLMLGDQDTDPMHKSLPDGPAAERQGPHRFARGQHFFAALQEQADRLGGEFNWRVHVVPGVGHSNSGMAPFAADLIEQHLRTTHAAMARVPATAGR